MTAHFSARGHFITLEGGEGSGKSTQLALLKRAYEQAGKPAYITREPGGTEGAESIRTLIMAREYAWGSTTEALLFAAARADHVEKIVIPHLDRGCTVFCDRFLDSTLVYQGQVLGKPFLMQLHHLSFGNLKPDITLLLDLPAENGLARVNTRKDATTRFDDKEIHFHTSVRNGFLALANAEPSRYAIIPANTSIETVHRTIIEMLNKRLGYKLMPAEGK